MPHQYQRDAFAVNNDQRAPVARQINKTVRSCGHRRCMESRLGYLSLILYDRCQDKAAICLRRRDRQIMAEYAGQATEASLRPLTDSKRPSSAIRVQMVNV